MPAGGCVTPAGMPFLGNSSRKSNGNQVLIAPSLDDISGCIVQCAREGTLLARENISKELPCSISEASLRLHRVSVGRASSGCHSLRPPACEEDIPCMCLGQLIDEKHLTDELSSGSEVLRYENDCSALPGFPNWRARLLKITSAPRMIALSICPATARPATAKPKMTNCAMR